MGNLALVAGGLGVIGRALVEHFSAREGWDVVALSRRKPDFATQARYEQVDLLDAEATRAALGRIGRVTHVFYAAYQEHAREPAQTQINLRMLQTLVRAAEAPGLRRVVLYEGVKYYGVHLGPFRTPAKEDDARHLPPNFYYDQEDWLRGHAAGKDWDFVALRPDVVCGFAVGNPMNLTLVIAVYAAISKELGVPLRFPGSAAAWRALAQVTDAGLLARASEWAATAAPRGEAYNVTNGDLFRWEQLWPQFARELGMATASPLPLKLATFMADKAPVWQRIVQKHGLLPYGFETIAAWGFGDFIFNCGYDVISATTKLRQAGFAEVVDSEEMFLRMFAEFRRRRVIP